MSSLTIRSRRLWQAIVVLAVAAMVVGGVGFWQSQRLTPSPAQADSSIPGMEALKSAESALETIVERVTPTVVRIEAVQSARQGAQEDEGEEQGAPDDLLRRFFGEPSPFRIPSPRGEPRPATSMGSGVIIDPRGYVLTARHVVNGADRITVELDSGEKLRGRVLATDSETDLAVVKVNPDKPLPAAPLGDADALKPGAYVIAIGSPFGLKHSVSVGHVSGTERQIPRAEAEGRPFRHMIQTDAAINRGNSGGPLVNIEGAVVGINNMIITPTSFNVGVGFAVAINSRTKGVIKSLEQGKQVERGLLGVKIQEVVPAIGNVYEVKEGAFVSEVIAGQAADKAGIHEEDVIVRYGDTEIKNPDDLVAAVEKTEPGTKVAVEVIREGKKVTLPVVIGVLEAKAEPKPVVAKPGGPLGITAQEITRALAERYRLDTQHGVVVTGLEPGGDAQRAGIMAGDVLLKINRHPIENMKDYEAAVKILKPRDPVVMRVMRGEQKYTLAIENLGE